MRKTPRLLNTELIRTLRNFGSGCHFGVKKTTQKTRLEAFGDGVLAIMITIMLLEMKVPHGETVAALIPLRQVLLSYAMSLVQVAIHWNNHHLVLHMAGSVTGPVLWANLHLLFLLSLFPFVTGWMGENHFAHGPSALYGAVLFMARACRILQRAIIQADGRDSPLAGAVASY